MMLANSYLIQSKLSLLELELESAQSNLIHARDIAREKGMKELENSISQEYNMLISQLSKWEKIRLQKPSFGEIIELTQFDDLIERMVKQKLYRDEEEISNYAQEAVSLFEKWEGD